MRNGGEMRHELRRRIVRIVIAQDADRNARIVKNALDALRDLEDLARPWRFRAAGDAWSPVALLLPPRRLAVRA